MQDLTFWLALLIYSILCPCVLVERIYSCWVSYYSDFMRSNVVSLLGIAVLAALVLYIALPLEHAAALEELLGNADGPRDLRDLARGLDLQGGSQILLEADLPPEVELDDGSMSTARIIVENRVNSLGVTEPLVQGQGGRRIIVELPGIDNPEKAIETLRATGQLEFIRTGNAGVFSGAVVNTTNRPNAVEETQQAIAGGLSDIVPLPFPDTVFETVMTGTVLRDAVPSVDDTTGQWQISFELTGEGSDQFFEYTNSNIGQIMPIVLDGRILATPVINSGIRDVGVISGSFSEDEARSLAIQMRYGALPVPLSVVDVRTIGATLGQNSVTKSLLAGQVGLSMVLLFMLVIYRLPGLLACLALVIYVALNVTVFKLIPVTLTLPGIAGFLLSIGMAVDANILIFERLREELRAGRSVRNAVRTGFNRAWPAIRDGNISTLISCAVLFWFGSSFGASVVKGFALTLSIGVVLSMFTAVLITRTFMRTLFSFVTGLEPAINKALVGH